MYHATTLQPTPTARQPILAFQPAPTRPQTLPPTPMPMHDFLVLSACPDFTPEFNAAGATNYRERTIQRCA